MTYEGKRGIPLIKGNQQEGMSEWLGEDGHGTDHRFVFVLIASWRNEALLFWVGERKKRDWFLDLPYFFRDDDLYDLFKECGPIEHFRVCIWRNRWYRFCGPMISMVQRMQALCFFKMKLRLILQWTSMTELESILRMISRTSLEMSFKYHA